MGHHGELRKIEIRFQLARRRFEQYGGTPEEIANAQADFIYVMGVMGHYVGDGSQPLHTTMYFNGWVGDNPNGYTTQYDVSRVD